MTHRERQRGSRTGPAICLVLPVCLVLALAVTPNAAEARGGRAASGPRGAQSGL